MKNSKWRIFQVVQFILFFGISLFLFFRKVDGIGAENTAEVKLISLAIWLGFYLFLLALEYGIRFLIAISKKISKKENCYEKENNSNYIY